MQINEKILWRAPLHAVLQRYFPLQASQMHHIKHIWDSKGFIGFVRTALQCTGPFSAKQYEDRISQIQVVFQIN